MRRLLSLQRRMNRTAHNRGDVLNRLLCGPARPGMLSCNFDSTERPLTKRQTDGRVNIRWRGSTSGDGRPLPHAIGISRPHLRHCVVERRTAAYGKFPQFDSRGFSCGESPGVSAQVLDRRLRQAHAVIEQASELVDLVVYDSMGLEAALPGSDAVRYQACPTRRQVSTAAPKACR
jgi:hypothetical protein